MSKLVNRITTGIPKERSDVEEMHIPTIDEMSEGCVRAFAIYADAMEEILKEEEGNKNDESEDEDPSVFPENREHSEHLECCGKNCCGNH